MLIACIQGDCMGLGVTMLPLFDLVIASDSATFATPYSSLGCIGEAAFLLGYPNLVSQGLVSKKKTNAFFKVKIKFSVYFKTTFII